MTPIRLSDGGGQCLAISRVRGILEGDLGGEAIGLSEKSAALLIDEHGELDVQRHAMYCLWMMDKAGSAARQHG